MWTNEDLLLFRRMARVLAIAGTLHERGNSENIFAQSRSKWDTLIVSLNISTHSQVSDNFARLPMNLTERTLVKHVQSELRQSERECVTFSDNETLTARHFLTHF